MDINSFAVVVQFNTYNLRCDMINIFNFILQINSFGRPLVYLNKRVLNTSPAYSINWTAFSVILMFSDLLFILKIVFEGSIFYKNTQVN